jgi:photosystem II stability/assembly factor-like uncharacterized protein
MERGGQQRIERLGRRPKARAVALLVALLASVAVQLVGAPDASAHTPHDDIFGVVLSPDFEHDGTVLTLSRGILLKSTDGGSTWHRIVKGLDNKVDLSALDMSCCASRVVYAASHGDGVYRSLDGGASWSKASQGLSSLDIDLLAASPTVDGLVYASGPGGLFRSLNAGATWESVPPGANASAIAFSPDDPDTVFVGYPGGALHVSDDAGRTWAPASFPEAGQITTIAAAPGGSDVFIGTSGAGVLRLHSGPANDGLTEKAVSSIALSPEYASDGTVWASLSDDGVFVSHDRGGTWARAADGLTTDRQADEPGYEDRPQFGQLRVAPGSAGPDARTLFLAGFDGLFTSDDGGAGWHELETLSSSIVVGLAVSPDYARDGTIAVTTYIDGAFLSTDRGQAWTAINDGLVEDAPFRTGADRFARLFGVAFSPAYAEDRTIVAALWKEALLSTSGGERWQKVAMPREGTAPAPLQQFVIAVSPAFSNDRTVILGTRSGDVYRSTNGGAAFTKVGTVQNPIRALATSPDFGSDGTAFAAAHRGVYETTDRGATWRQLTGQLPDPTSLAVSPALASDRTMFAGTRGGLYVTREGGRGWTRVETAPFAPDAYIEAVALSPSFGDDGTILVSVRGQGLFRSTDHGSTFAAIAPELLDSNQVLSNFANPTATPIVFSPDFAHDHTIYGYSGTAVLRSTDAGDTWERVDPPRTLHDVTAPATHEGSSRRPWLVVGSVIVIGMFALWAVKRLMRAPRAP